MHDTGLADRGRRGVAVGRRIITATVAAVVVRGLAWLVSLFIAGPVLGTTLFALLNESRLGKASAVVLEAALALMSIAASIAVAVGIRRDEPHWRPGPGSSGGR
jgi:hypothetical protein